MYGRLMTETDDPRRITRFSTTGGCAAKVGPGELLAMTQGLCGTGADHRVLVGTETGDDAGVVIIPSSGGEHAVVVTADFITPVVDDPFRFGAIAAANALSDVFAMGGEVLTAIALCAFPRELAVEVAREILEGGDQKTREAGGQVVGGHTVRNPELLYGLAVTGLVHPQKVIRNVGARVGDQLVLTKALGTGLVVNGRRKGLGSDANFEAALASMAFLNRPASRVAVALGAHAMTDVTGFALVGHALKMALGSSSTLRIELANLPILEGALELARAGVTTGSTKPNRAAAAGKISIPTNAPPEIDQLVHDPQTSGGLLIAIAAEQCDELLKRLADAGVTRAARIGEVISAGEFAIDFV